MEQFKDKPAPPCPHCGEDEAELIALRGMVTKAHDVGFEEGRKVERRELARKVKVLKNGEEHQRLADAASELIEAMDPNAWGDMPEILCSLAKQVRESKNHMNRWTVLSKRGGIIIDWPEHDKRRADEWMARNKKHIDGDTSYMAGAKLVLMDVPTEAETLNARIKELENKLKKARKRIREIEARLRERDGR